jgi:hypothetical protein
MISKENRAFADGNDRRLPPAAVAANVALKGRLASAPTWHYAQ